MRIKLEQLSQSLQKQAGPLYTLSGNETLLIMEAADLIRMYARQHGYTERELFIIDQHFDWSDLLNAGTNLSLFGERKFLDIRIPSGKPGREGGKAIETFCSNLPLDALTLVTLPKIDKQSQAAKWFKALEYYGTLIPIYSIERQQLPSWIGQRLTRQRQRTDAATLQFLADQVEGNLLAAYQEIQKLALIYPAGDLSCEQVKDAVLDVARYDVYQLSDAMLAADTTRYTRILSGLQGEGTPPLLILATLTEQIRQLISIRAGLGAGESATQLLSAAKIWGERQKTVMAACKRINMQLLMQGLSHAAEIDRIIKGVARGDSWEELLQLGLRFAVAKT